MSTLTPQYLLVLNFCAEVAEEVNTLAVYAYEDVLKELGSTAYLLLGNGFSISCDPVFSYGKLYDKAVDAGLSQRAQAVFERFGTNNFEGVMRALDDSDWIARLYEKLDDADHELLDDVEV